MRVILMIIMVMGVTPFSLAFDSSHNGLTDVMKEFNNDGFINYKALKSNPQLLDNYLTTLKQLSPNEYSKWTNNDKIAFWVNAYNAYTLKAIIDNYPIKSSFLKSRIYPKNSIRQIDGVWDEMKFPVMGDNVTLNHMEHEVLRKEFTEPRIHMALVCAAYGCPPLREEAYTGEKLNNQLNDQTVEFLKSPLKFRIDRSRRKVFISSIFDWFGNDFVKTFGSTPNFAKKKESVRAVLNFLSAYLNESDKKYLIDNRFDVEFQKYDWTLNEQK